jgi:hypothetical protein
MGAGRQLGTDRYCGREVQLAEVSGRAGSLRPATPVSPSTALPSAVDPCSAARSEEPNNRPRLQSFLYRRVGHDSASPAVHHAGSIQVPVHARPTPPPVLYHGPANDSPYGPAYAMQATSAGPQARHAGGLRTSLGREEGRGSLTVQNS